MASTDRIQVASLYRYPVKGLSPDKLDAAVLEAGGTMPFDRAFAIENGPGRFDPEHPKHLPKITFLMLVRNERLATLQTRFDDASQTLTVLRDGKQVARGDLSTLIGRQMIEQFFAAYMKDDLRGAPRIVQAEGHSFSDKSEKCLHIINLTNIKELERAIGQSVDPLRFRANIYVKGLPAWAEFKWLDKTLTIGDCKLAVFARTDRCAATDVDPQTGARDMAIAAVLQRNWGHMDFGVYAKVVEGGRIKSGDDITVA